MRASPVLVVHILAGIAGLIAGAGAMIATKGGVRHRMYGNVFFVSMLVLGTTAAVIAYRIGDFGNMTGGLFTVYMVATAWRTARTVPGRTNAVDWIGMGAIVIFGAKLFYDGVQVWKLPHHMLKGVPAGMIFFLATIALLSAIGDARMIFGGVSETGRIARHLWRMCFALFVATGSFFLGRIRIFPMWVRDAYIPFVLAVLPLLLLIFWLVRVHVTGRYGKVAAARMA
jgi:uncharacterized membrane protein